MAEASPTGLPAIGRYVAARNLAIDRLTAETVTAFEAEGIPVMLFKGPLLQEALYPDRVRAYGDSDLLVRAADWERAVALLQARGFVDYLGPLGHPRMESLAGTAFVRGADNVDLHATLEGVQAPPEEVWRAFWEGAERRRIGGREVSVPGRATMLMHLALHAGRHPGQTKPAEDLRRGVRRAGVGEWHAAAAVAARLGALAMFAEGLRRVPEGETLARSLHVDEVRSVQTRLRTSRVPIAEGLQELLAGDLTPAQRVRRVRSELLPSPRFMRWHSALARRGALGLALAYPARWWFLARRLPAAVAEVRRARGARG